MRFAFANWESFKFLTLTASDVNQENIWHLHLMA